MRDPVSFAGWAELLHLRPSAPENRAHARRVLAMAEDPQEADEVSVRELLLAASAAHEAAGDLDDAAALLRRAAEQPGGHRLDVRPDLHRVLLEAGRDQEARAVTEELRHERPTPASALGDVAAELWERGRLEEAHRWYSVAASRVLREVESEATSPGQKLLPSLLEDRTEVRAELGLSRDGLDELGDRLLEEELDDDLEGV